jgi:hypothetical protein
MRSSSYGVAGSRPAFSCVARSKTGKSATCLLDLSEAYEHGRKLGATFGDLVDAWEVDNEPDLGFVPESAERYTAFLKAMYLGLQRGFAEAKHQVASSAQRAVDPKSLNTGTQPPRTPLVVMGSLGLPAWSLAGTFCGQ